jgi:hypothetical protein
MKKLVIIAVAACLSLSGLAIAIETDFNNVDWHQRKVVWNTLTSSEQAAYMDLYEHYLAANKDQATQVTALGVPLKGQVRTPGDDCGTATNEISVFPYSDSGDTTALVNDYDVLSSVTCNTAFDSNGPDMVYQIQVDQDCDLTVTESADTHDVVLWAVTDCADVDNTCIGSSDSGNPESFTFFASAGTDYWLIVDGWNGESGPYTLDITDTNGIGCSLVPVELQSFSAE